MSNDFYVGYGKAPTGYKLFMLIVAPAFLIIATLVGVWWASAQDDTGPGVWGTTEMTIEGLLEMTPYPVLRVAREDGSGVETWLLVEIDKNGVGKRTRNMTGQYVRMTGVEVMREGRRMLSLIPGPDGAVVMDRAPAGYEMRLASGPITPLGSYTLKGEIIDSKCYLGVMKPGQGKTHKACATLCILGDIPPMFAVKHEDGSQSAYLLTDLDGNAIKDLITPFVADPVEVTGAIGWRGDMPVFMIDPSSITRL